MHVEITFSKCRQSTVHCGTHSLLCALSAATTTTTTSATTTTTTNNTTTTTTTTTVTTTTTTSTTTTGFSQQTKPFRTTLLRT
jgi:hypothetical protein